MLQRSMVDSANAVKQCQWQQKEIDCGRLFVNKPTDSGLCFTFNPALELLVAYRLRNSSDDKESWNGKTAYGTSVNESTVFISFETGLSSGLSLVLLSNSSDYCGSVQERAGFTAVVHDRSAEPLLQMSKDIRLSPGFIANVAMTLQKTERQTESFGYCKSSLYLRMYKAVVPYTSSDFYTQNCLSEGILLRCGCLPFYTPRTNNFIYEEFPEIIGPQNRSISIPTCGLSGSLDELNCQTSVENNLLHRESICYRFRPKPCRETNIRTETSFTKFPSARMLSNWNRRFGTHYALDQFRLNFVVVNFFYHDYEYTQLGEKIKMTWVDLMNQIGGAAGMTLGISIVGGIECICWFFFQVLLSCLKLKNVCKNTQTLKYNYTDLLA